MRSASLVSVAKCVDSSKHGSVMPMNWAKANHGLRKFASTVRAVFSIEPLSPGRVAVGDVVRRGGFVPPVPTIGAGLSGGFLSARGAFGQQRGNDHEGVGEHRCADQQREALCGFSTATLHAA